MRRVLALLAMGLLLAIPCSAAAQAVDTGTVLEVRQAAASLTVRFSSDPRTCKAVGRCHLRGEVRFSSTGPAVGGGFFGIVDNSPVGGGGFFQPDGATIAAVYGGGQTCRDRLGHRVTAFAARQDATQVQITFFAPSAASGEDAEGIDDPLSTRCPGPRLADLRAAKALPVASLPLAQVRGSSVSFASEGRRGFTASGFAVRASWHVEMTAAASAAPIG